MVLNFRSVVFKRAHQIFKTGKYNFSEALKMAWKRYHDFKESKVKELARLMDSIDIDAKYSDDWRISSRSRDLKFNIQNELKRLPVSFIDEIEKYIDNIKLVNSFRFTRCLKF